MKQQMPEIKFSTDYALILNKIKDLDPLQYAKTRNFVDGFVYHFNLEAGDKIIVVSS